MHIPDAAISPSTSLAAAAVMVPVWATASRRVRESLSSRQLPLVAVTSAFCFTIMMFNVPAPGGTTVHPIGAGLMAVVVGPWAAIVGMTVALTVQALFFGDGGVLALGVNCFTMAFAQPIVAYAIYRLAARKRSEPSRQALAAAAGAYVGLLLAALLAAIVLGIQPALFHDAQRHALYFPFDLRVTMPAILLPHLTIAGVAEAAVTFSAVAWLIRSGVPLYGTGESRPEARPVLPRRAVALLLLLLALSPLGMLASGEAWGEWGVHDLAQRVGYTPSGLAHTESHGWKGFDLLPDYLSQRGPAGYLFAGLVGLLMVGGLTYLVIGTKRKRPDPVRLPAPSVSGGTVPTWMRAANEDESASTDSIRSTGYIQRTLEALTGEAHSRLREEKLPRAEGHLQGWDARIKIATVLALLVAIALTNSFWLLVVESVPLLLAARRSRVPLRSLLSRTCAAVGLFSGAVVVPVALNVVTPGRDLLLLWRSPHISITQPGVQIASPLLLRVALSVGVVLLLSMTTRWQDLLRGLRMLRVPRPFILVLMMTYRYLLVFMASAAEMFAARRSRTVGRSARGSDQGFVGGVIGALFAKSLALTEEVHSAMLARGWTGEA